MGPRDGGRGEDKEGGEGSDHASDNDGGVDATGTGGSADGPRAGVAVHGGRGEGLPPSDRDVEESDVAVSGGGRGRGGGRGGSGRGGGCGGRRRNRRRRPYPSMASISCMWL